MQISKGQLKALLTILFIVLFTSQSCAGIVPTATPTTMPIATETVKRSTTKTPTPKPTGSNTPDSVATADFIETASINTIMSTVQPDVLETHSSPDGKWRVEVIRYDCINYPHPDYTASIAYEQLKLINLTDGSEQTIEDQLQNCDGIGGGGLKGLLWSPNNRYYYYTDWREGFPETCGNYIVPTIYRLDTVTQETITIGGAHTSPDQTKLAMWEWQENEIVIWDLDRGEVGRIQGLAPNAVNGPIAWSPDGQSLAYLQTTFDCALDYGTTYVTRLDLAEMTQTLLIRYESPGFGGISWNASDQITLLDGEGKLWIYDLIRRDIEPAPTTITPVPPGVFALKFYPPLIMEYDTSEWKDESRYEDIRVMGNYLQTRKLETSCILGVQGPTDFNGTPPVFVPIQLGEISYSVIFWGDIQPGDKSAWYIENQSLTGYDYSPGLPILVIQASSSEWERCKALAEKVLSTLRVP